MKKVLVIQTAFIGDTILATSVLEKLHTFYPKTQIDFLVRNGNQSLFSEHPFIRKLWVWEKQNGKYRSLFKLIKSIRKEKYDLVINIQRFFSSGLLTAFSGAEETIGFKKNPLSSFYTQRIGHVFGKEIHEVDRNNFLIEDLTDHNRFLPKLYPTLSDIEKVKQYQSEGYICIAPASVWFTKQFPKEKWIEFILEVPKKYTIYLLGSPDDNSLGEEIKQKTKNRPINLAGKLSLLASAALMKGAKMNFVNDSSPMHLASSVNAPVAAVFCSTVQEFGFGPLSDRSFIIEYSEELECKPCGLHGKKNCPKMHFMCASGIQTYQLLECID